MRASRLGRAPHSDAWWGAVRVGGPSDQAIPGAELEIQGSRARVGKAAGITAAAGSGGREPGSRKQPPVPRGLPQTSGAPRRDLHASPDWTGLGPPGLRSRPLRAAWLWGALPGWAGVLLIALAVGIGTVVTVEANRPPGLVLCVSLLAGSVLASLWVRPSAVYVIFPVPAPVYVVAASIAGLIHDRGVDSSRTFLALNFVQWIASGFLAMVAATAAAAAITGYRWLHRKTRATSSSVTSDRHAARLRRLHPHTRRRLAFHSVCLLIVVFQLVPEAPLLVAANRDERYDRPTEAMTVLRERDPRILGGRDLLAGGTWLAVNEHGLVAGLNNQPSAAGRDPAKRTRGELPLAFAKYADAAEAVAVVGAKLNPADYNPCWMLVGDRHSLFSVGLAGGDQPEIEQLEPGLHILENVPLGAPSAKVDLVRRLVGSARPPGAGAAQMTAALEQVLRSHEPAVPVPVTDDTGRIRPAELSAPCVHTPGHGTRSSTSVTVPIVGMPVVAVADAPLCQGELHDRTCLWSVG